MNKLEAVKALVALLRPEDLVVCCNGMIGRELYTVRDRPGSFYMIGSMGLGLSGSKRLVDDFSIDSAPGRGTTVRMIKWTRF